MTEAEGAAATRPAEAGKPWFGQFFWRDPNTQFLFLSAVAGALGGIGAIIFRAATGRLTELLVDGHDIIAGAESLPVALRVFLPAAGGLLGGLVLLRFLPGPSTSGVSQMIEVVA